MDQGFTFCFKKGFRKAKAVFKTSKFNYLKYYLYLIASGIGRLLFFPIFYLSDQRIARMATRNETIVLTKAFTGADKPHSIWTMLLYGFLYFIMLMAGIALIGIITSGFGILGFFCGGAKKEGILSLSLVIAFTVPGAIALLCFIILFVLLFAAGPYIIYSNSDITVSSALYNSTNALKNTGKWTYFSIHFVFTLCMAAYIGVGYGIIMLIQLFGKTEAFKLAILIVETVLFLGFIFLLPILTLARNVAIFSLLEDIVSLDENVVEFKEKEEINPADIPLEPIKDKKEAKKIMAQQKEDLLLSLFSDSPEQKAKAEEEYNRQIEEAKAADDGLLEEQTENKEDLPDFENSEENTEE